MADKAKENGIAPNQWFDLCDKKLVEAWRTAESAWAPLERDWRASQKPRGRPPYLHGRTYGDRGFTSPPRLPDEGEALAAALAALRADFKARLGDGRIVVAGYPQEGVEAELTQIPGEWIPAARVMNDRMKINGAVYTRCRLYRPAALARLIAAQAGGGGDRQTRKRPMRAVSAPEKNRVLNDVLRKLIEREPHIWNVEEWPRRRLYDAVCEAEPRIRDYWSEERGKTEVSREWAAVVAKFNRGNKN